MTKSKIAVGCALAFANGIICLEAADPTAVATTAPKTNATAASLTAPSQTAPAARQRVTGGLVAPNTNSAISRPAGGANPPKAMGSASRNTAKTASQTNGANNSLAGKSKAGAHPQSVPAPAVPDGRVRPSNGHPLPPNSVVTPMPGSKFPRLFQPDPRVMGPSESVSLSESAPSAPPERSQ